jgi:hypothetical protein
VWRRAKGREPGVWSACVRVLKQVRTNELELALPEAMLNVTALLNKKLAHDHPQLDAILDPSKELVNDTALKKAHIRRLAEYRNRGNLKWYKDPALLIDVPLQKVLIRCQERAQRPARVPQ